MQESTQKLILSAMFVALGVLFPILFHAAGLGGAFLPMFWPVAAAGFFLPPSFAVAVGALTPILSFLLTGMPPVSPPIVFVMMTELPFLSGIISIAYRKTRWGFFWLLLISLIVSRIILFLSAGMLAPFLGLPSDLVSIASILQGIPGIFAILIFVPLLLGRIKHEALFTMRKSSV